MSRHRALLAASQMSGGGDNSMFPLYLETTEIYNGNFQRNADEISIALVDWIEQHWEPDKWGDLHIPENVLMDNPVYIDGVQITRFVYLESSIYFGPYAAKYGYVDAAVIYDGTISNHERGEICVYTDN